MFFKERNNKTSEEYFDVFIDYQNDTLDWIVALKLFHILKNFKIPKQLRDKSEYAGKIFLPKRERDSLDQITEEEKHALLNSKFMIIICSRNTRGSIRTTEFLSLFPLKQNILTLLIQGEPEESFPNILYEIEYAQINKYAIYENENKNENAKENVEPLAADIRDTLISVMIKKLEEVEKYRLIAQVLDCQYDDFIHRHKHMNKQKKLAIGIMGFVFLYLFIMIGFAQMLQLQNKVSIEADQDISYYLEELFTDHQYEERQANISSHLETVINSNSQYSDITRTISEEADKAIDRIE